MNQTGQDSVNTILERKQRKYFIVSIYNHQNQNFRSMLKYISHLNLKEAAQWRVDAFDETIYVYPCLDYTPTREEQRAIQRLLQESTMESMSTIVDRCRQRLWEQ